METIHQNMEVLQIPTLFLTFAALFFAWHFAKRLRRNGNKKLPQSPPTLPIVGNLHQISEYLHRSLRKLSRKYGPDLMLVHLGSKPLLVASSANAAKEIMKTHDLAFASRVEMRDLKKLFYDMKDMINLPYGELWRMQRSIFMQELMSSKRLKTYSSLRNQEIELVMDKLRECSLSSTPVNLTEMFMTLTCDIISRVALGKKHGKVMEIHEKKFLEVLGEGASLTFKFTIGEFIPWLGWISRINGYNAALDSCAKRKDEVIDAIIEDHLNRSLQSESEDEKENFVDILLGIYKGNTPGVSIDLLSVKALVLDAFVGGTETSASTLVWTMAELIRHPTAMKTLQDEIREIMKGRLIITDDDLQKMRYLKAVIKEIMRYRPSVAVYFHCAREYVNLMGYDVEPGTAVMVNAWAIGRDPAIWDEPEKFKPERFLDFPVDYMGFDFQLIPFGAGRRICPGLGFAINNIEHTLANMLHKFDWALPDGAKGEDLDVQEKSGMSIRKKTPLIVIPSLNPNIDSSHD